MWKAKGIASIQLDLLNLQELLFRTRDHNHNFVPVRRRQTVLLLWKPENLMRSCLLNTDCTLQRFNPDMVGMTKCAPGTKERIGVSATTPTTEKQQNGTSMAAQASF